MPVNDLIKEKIRQVLPDVKVVVAWGKGYDALHATPLFIEKESDLENLDIGPCSVQNLASYLLDFAAQNSGKVGIVVKGCDSRSVMAQLQENLIKREDVVIIGFPCEGVFDLKKFEAALPANSGKVLAVERKGDTVNVKLEDQELNLSFLDVVNQRCMHCRWPNAVLSDHFVGLPLTAKPLPPGHDLFAELEEKSAAERMEFWKNEMSRCIRCYACRNACPLCACKDHCVAQSREPHWVSQDDSLTDKWFFQVIHASHLSGRCTSCGECQRVCPMNIPVGLFKRKFNGIVKELFDYEAGLDQDATPPLQTFSLEELKIKERDW